MSQPPDTWASEMPALQDQIERLTLELEVARSDEASAHYWAGEEYGSRGAAGRWEEALSEPIPKAGVMREPLESLYRRTETLRLDLASAISEIAYLRGANDGYLHQVHVAMAAIEKHWAPHDPISSNIRDELLERLGATANAAWEAAAARLRQ